MSTVWIDFIQASIEATQDFNIERIDAIYNEATSLYPIEMVTERLIQPVVSKLGKGWIEQPEKGIAEEHFYTSWLKNKLGARFHHAYSQAKGARIICACVPGSYHEIGLMLFSLSAMARGYRVLYFGADLPLNQLSYIAERSAAKAIVLGSHIQMYDTVNAELIELMPKLKTPVFVGGTDKLTYRESFESAGGILLGTNIAVGLRVFESHIPVYTASAQRK
jgi:methanogenic corrinoid protein MtbC1